MPRDSRSPPRQRSENERNSARNYEEHRRLSRYEDDSRKKSGRSRYNGDNEGRRRRDYDSRSSWGYGEQERERERQQDRDRYYRERDRERRSASPRRAMSRGGSPTGDNKTKPNFAPSGLLAAETNTVRAAIGEKTILKYNEPPEARRPTKGWRLYVFKGDEQVDLLHIHRQSAYLIGRDRLVADIAIDHPSCSKQHAVIQYRFVREKDEFGDTKGVIKPYIIDLESTNSTRVNDVTIPASRFYELKPNDIIKLGTSEREYVLLHDEAA